jgi:hypothetical protein
LVVNEWGRLPVAEAFIERRFELGEASEVVVRFSLR